MDHDAQGEEDSTIMSRGCNSRPAPDLLGPNLNLSSTNCLSLEVDGDAVGLLTGPTVNDNGRLQEEQAGMLRGEEEEEEEEEEEDDTDALMNEEDDESEASSLLHCQSPGTPMTDSSYSDTGSLLETAFSPGTSPEPCFLLSPEELIRCDGGRPDPAPEAPSSPVEPGPAPTPEPSLLPLDSLGRLAEQGDDPRLPERLHQIAEASVLRGDYQEALCCVHLQKLYHQRALENLHSLQELWERGCRQVPFSMDTKDVEALQQLCRTHTRPRLTDTLRPPEESSTPTHAVGDAVGLCPAAKQTPADSWTSHSDAEELRVCEGGRGEEDDAASGWGHNLHPPTARARSAQGGDGEEELRKDGVGGKLETLVSWTEEDQVHGDVQQDQQNQEEDEEEEQESADVMGGAATLDHLARLITVEELSPAAGLVSILKRRSLCEEDECARPEPDRLPAKRRVRFKVSDDAYESELGGGDSCLLLFLLCLVTVVISLGGTALYCALGDPHSSVCQDFSRNLDFYVGQSQRVATQIQHWFVSGSP